MPLLNNLLSVLIQGDPDALWIFRCPDGAVNVMANSQVTLTNIGGSTVTPVNVFWTASSIFLRSGSSFLGYGIVSYAVYLDAGASSGPLYSANQINFNPGAAHTVSTTAGVGSSVVVPSIDPSTTPVAAPFHKSHKPSHDREKTHKPTKAPKTNKPTKQPKVYKTHKPTVSVQP